jgi:hypothetical protein
MTSPKTDEVLTWLKQEEIKAKDRGLIMDLQAELANATTRSSLSYWTHIARMQAYQTSTLSKLGVSLHFNPGNLYRPLGFGIKGQPGYFSWNTIQARLNLRGPRPTGEVHL